MWETVGNVRKYGMGDVGKYGKCGQMEWEMWGNMGNVGKYGKCGKIWEMWANGMGNVGKYGNMGDVGIYGKCGKLWENMRNVGKSEKFRIISEIKEHMGKVSE
jgi:hypothetical protein